MKEKVEIAKGVSIPKTKVSELKKKPGMSNVGKYKDLSKKNFAGPDGTYPIQDLAHARNALARAHFSSHPEEIKKKVYKKYPDLKKRAEKK